MTNATFSLEEQVSVAEPVGIGRHHTADYLEMIGVPRLPPLSSPFDPGYDPLTLQGHL